MSPLHTPPSRHARTGATTLAVGGRRHGRAWPPAPVGEGFVFDAQSLVRTGLAVVVVVTIVLAGAGFGTNAGLDGTAPGIIGIGDDDETPPPPTVEVTPDAEETPPERTPSTPDGPQTPTERTVSATLDLAAADPGPVRTSDGTVGSVHGLVSGTLQWTGTADAAVLVVQSWVPGSGWEELRRVTVTTPSPVALSDVLGETAYATGRRAAAFENPVDGTTERTDGRLAVTAVLFVDGVEVTRTQATDEFTVTVTNVDTETPSLDLELGGQGWTTVYDSGEDGSDDGSVVPGSSGVSRVTLSNRGADTGVLELSAIEYRSDENGLTGPESAVDDTGGDPGVGAGELHEALEVRVSLEASDGSSRYVVGNETSYRTLASLAGERVPLGRLDGGESVALVVEFRLPATTGNEIQSDSIVVDFRFGLRTN